MKFLTDHDVQTFSEQLDREYGINTKYTTEYILVWAEAYEVNHIEMNLKTHETPQNCTTNSLAKYFESCGFEIIDKRKSGGCLWVVGEKAELEFYVTRAKELFALTDGGYAKGRATGGRHGWYTAFEK